MNLKKTILSLVAVTALTMSVGTPIVMAESGQSAEVTAEEIGEFGYSMVFGSVNFSSSAPVSTNEGIQLVSSRGQVNYHDDHAYNETAWTVYIRADDFTTSGGFTIDNQYLSVRIRSGQQDLCTNDGNPELPVEGNNTYQAITTAVPEGTSTGGVSLGSDNVVLLNGTVGRGCGAHSIGIRYTLDLPAGTYTAGDTAVYTTNIVLTETAGPGIGEGE